MGKTWRNNEYQQGLLAVFSLTPKIGCGEKRQRRHKVNSFYCRSTRTITGRFRY